MENEKTMPLVKIDLIEGKPLRFITDLMDIVHEAMTEVLKIPAEDKNIRVSQYNHSLFTAKPPYEYFIEILMFSGRSKEAKAKLYKTLVTKLNEKLNIEPTHVFIVINEQPTENWGLRGGVSGADITFNFNINV